MLARGRSDRRGSCSMFYSKKRAATVTGTTGAAKQTECLAAWVLTSGLCV
jgi:hypothetical protein